jgi:hypothetical protein
MSPLQSELGLTEEEVIDEVNKQWGGYISISYLKEAYDRLLHRCNELEHPGDDEEVEELETIRTKCIKAFLLLLIDLTIFGQQEQQKHSYDMVDGVAGLGQGARVVLGRDDTCFSLHSAYS